MFSVGMLSLLGVALSLMMATVPMVHTTTTLSGNKCGATSLQNRLTVQKDQEWIACAKAEVLELEEREVKVVAVPVHTLWYNQLTWNRGVMSMTSKSECASETAMLQDDLPLSRADCKAYEVVDKKMYLADTRDETDMVQLLVAMMAKADTSYAEFLALRIQSPLYTAASVRLSDEEPHQAVQFAFAKANFELAHAFCTWAPTATEKNINGFITPSCGSIPSQVVLCNGKGLKRQDSATSKFLHSIRSTAQVALHNLEKHTVKIMERPVLSMSPSGALFRPIVEPLLEPAPAEPTEDSGRPEDVELATLSARSSEPSLDSGVTITDEEVEPEIESEDYPELEFESLGSSTDDPSSTTSRFTDDEEDESLETFSAFRELVADVPEFRAYEDDGFVRIIEPDVLEDEVRKFMFSRTRKLSSASLMDFNRLHKQLMDDKKSRREKKISKRVDPEVFVEAIRIDQSELSLRIFGDIHGSVHSLTRDLQDLIADDWTLLDKNTVLVFLGDYVDRGNWATEVLFLLYKLYNKNPDQVLIVRGNHETATFAIPKSDFGAELSEKYDEDLDEIVELIFDSYSFLPVCIFLNDPLDSTRSYMFVHGGIDMTWSPTSFLKRHRDRNAAYSNTFLTHKRRVDNVATYISSLLPVAPPSLKMGLGTLLSSERKFIFYDTTAGDSSEIQLENPDPDSDSDGCATVLAAVEMLQSYYNVLEDSSGFLWSDFLYPEEGSATVPLLVYNPFRGFAVSQTVTNRFMELNWLTKIFRAHQHNNAAGPVLVQLAAQRGIVPLSSPEQAAPEDESETELRSEPGNESLGSESKEMTVGQEMVGGWQSEPIDLESANVFTLNSSPESIADRIHADSYVVLRFTSSDSSLIHHFCELPTKSTRSVFHSLRSDSHNCWIGSEPLSSVDLSL